MILDFHTHLFPPAIRENRQSYFSGEPAFESLYSTAKSKLAGTEEILSTMEAQGIDRAVVFGFPWKNPDTYRRHNDYIMEAVSRHPDRLVGLGCFDPHSRPAAREAERCLEAGLAGLGELAFYSAGIDDSALDVLAPIMAICLKHHLPVLIHTNEPVGHKYPGKTPNTLGQIYRLVRRFSSNRIVLAHWGGGIFFFNLLKKEVRQALQNVYFDTAASPYLYQPAVYRIALELAGEDKILFGSDFPLLPPARYFKEIKQAGLTAEQIKNICGANAARLLGLY